ncbi:hypothetical protein WG901_06260 [Novosphingobium sp. PS1R-30]|uniref:Uncharacterized protein n=1 Tax=Novosphingobium anseongense TaxID=3133436 RepID=A0ABU8RT23_9SPHN|nr:MAG: hypothetical protein EOO76_00765 [Novosphingobium sp.]
MPIQVQFPDGSTVEVPSRRAVARSRKRSISPPSVAEYPDPDPFWLFQQDGNGKWHAKPRR